MARRKGPSGFAARLREKKELRSRTVVVRLPASLHERLRVAAKKHDVTVSKFVRMAILEGLERLK